MGGLAERILSAGESLTNSERSLADYIMRNPQAPAFLSAARLGDAAGVSESTVVRFARAMGFAGYPAMQRSVQEQIQHRLEISTTERFQHALQVGGGKGLAQRAFEVDLENLRLTAQTLNPEQLERVVERLVQARRLYVIGLRTSAGITHFLAHSLTVLLGDVRNLAHVSDALPEHLVGAGPEDVAIVISLARPSRRAVQGARLARGYGTHVIAVTDSLSNSLARNADEVLLAFTDSVAFVQSYASVFALCHALIAAVGEKMPARTEGLLQRLEAVLHKEGFVETD